ncbi:hypothetical protein GCM10010191_90650 [Actinomadura vinacea]|uniref:Uncharacterized protein n=1 Tax=Actinomadura vinacea TaxID=115336 RepID=A0ABP5XID4_9ACTN
MSDAEIDLSLLVKAMEGALESEFPGWLITRESSGRWTATRPDWGQLYAKNSIGLRAKLSGVVTQEGNR